MTPDATAPRLLLSAKYQCPHPPCNHLVYYREPLGGWDRCERCRGDFYSWMLPPGATGCHVLQLFGAEVASTVLRRLFRALEDLPDDLLWQATLVGRDHAAWILVTARAREKHLYHWTRGRDLLVALGVVAQSSAGA